MFYWITKIFALLTVVALLMGLAATTTTLMGDVRSLTHIPGDRDPPFGLMLAVTKAKGKGKEIKCEAYAWGTDFNQRPGSIFHAGFYHALTTLLTMLIQQGLRGLTPNTLQTLFRFVPALQGKGGLAGSGAAMIYVGFQMLSYSMGKLHLLAAAILILTGILNIIGSFIDPILYANAPPPVSGGAQGDPFGSGDMYGGPPGEMGMDDMGVGAPPMGGGPPPPASSAQPPDPYGEGVGAGSAPPGVIDKPPNDDDSDDEDGQMRYDPRTGQWTSKSKTLPTGPFMPGMMGMPTGYNMYGQPVMNPYGGFIPGMIPGAGDEKRSSRELKKAIKRRARKELEKMKRREEESDESSGEDEDEHLSRRAARYQNKEAARRARDEEERQRAFERQIREEEKRQQMIARGIAIQDARQRAAREVAEEDARMQNYQEMIDNQREMAMTDAQKQVFQDELDQMKEQQQLLLARKRAEMDAAARAAADEELYNRQQGPEVMPYQQQQWQYPPQTSQRRMSYASRTGSPPSYRPSGAESRWPSLGPLKFPGQPSAPPSYQESRRGQQGMQQKHPYPNHNGEEYDSDDTTEIQSVGSETSADRRLVAQREREERERVLKAQEKQRQYSRSRGYTR